MAMTVAIAIAAAAPSPVATFGFLSRSRPRTRWAMNRLSSLSTQSSSPLKELILYSKPGCCLCDGLKEKLNAAFSLGGPDSLADVQLQVRDISTNAEWEKRYEYEIPVLARLLSDGTEALVIDVGNPSKIIASAGDRAHSKENCSCTERVSEMGLRTVSPFYAMYDLLNLESNSS